MRYNIKKKIIVRKEEYTVESDFSSNCKVVWQIIVIVVILNCDSVTSKQNTTRCTTVDSRRFNHTDRIVFQMIHNNHFPNSIVLIPEKKKKKKGKL